MTTFISCLFLLLTHQLAAGVFTSTPKEISPLRTKSVVIRCDPEVENNVSILAIQIMKSSDTSAFSPAGKTEDNSEETNEQQETATTPAEFPLPVLGRRRKRSSDDKLVTATITIGNNIDKVPKNDRLKAEGQLERPPFLSVSIDSPGVDDIGVYKCEITLLDFKLGVRTTSELLQIREVIEMGMDDLEQRVKVLEADRQSSIVAIQQMKKQVKECVQVIGFAQDDIEYLRKRTDDLLNTITEMTEQVRSLSNRMPDGGKPSRVTGSGRGDKQTRPGDPGNEELFKLSARIDQLTTHQLQALASKLQELRDYERKTQEKVIELDGIVRGAIEKRLTSLENLDWKGLSKSLQEIEIKTIPVIIMNITETHKNVTEIQNRLDKCCPDAPETPDENNLQTTQTVTVTTTEEPVVNYTGPACYVCGDNITDTPCEIKDSKHTEACPSKRPLCITDVYDNARTRNVYKRCASEKECQEDGAKSSPQCNTTDFRTLAVMQCHFCCRTQLCNEFLRPQDDSS
ncbi:hypothetical protein BsWGS_03934 [Bradybaena similaris]